MLEALLNPVEDGPGPVKGCPALAHGIEYVLCAAHIEVGLLLAGEAGVGQILGGGA